MQSPQPEKILAYAIAAVTISAGVALLTGLIQYDVMPQVRYTFGAVLMLMGIYRFLITYFRPKPSRWRRLTDADDE